MEKVLFWGVPAASLLALLLAWYFYRQMMKESEGTPVMQKIALYVRQGAMSYLKQQYKIVGMVFIALVVLFSIMAYGFDLSLGACCVPDRRFLFRIVRISRHEDGDLCFGAHCQCGA